MFFEMPEEMRAELAKRHEEALMQQENYHHSVQHLFDELNQEQLLTLRWMLHNMSADESGRLASYYEGTASQTLQIKFNVCPGCGKDHAEEMLRETDTEAKSVGGTPYSDVNFEEKVAPSSSGLTADDLLNMQLYHLDDLRDEDTHQLLGFICTLCGLKYQSIEDRMLRAPDECHGCIQKAKFG